MFCRLTAPSPSAYRAGMGSGDTDRTSKALKAMRAAMMAGDWWTAVRNCRIVVRWFDSFYGAGSPSTEVWHQMLAASIKKYRETRRWWQWPWP